MSHNRFTTGNPSFSPGSPHWRKEMASIIEKKLVKILECAICLDSYEEPKVLPCQHTYCRKCLEQLAFGDGRIRKVTCPECRRVIKVRQKARQKQNINIFIVIEKRFIYRFLLLMLLQSSFLLLINDLHRLMLNLSGSYATVCG